jgi:hypothetical protein
MEAIILSVDALSRADFEHALTMIDGVMVSRVPVHLSRSEIYQDELKSEHEWLTMLNIVISSSAIAVALRSVRDIIIEHIRTRRCHIEIKLKNGRTLVFDGPIHEANRLEQLRNAIHAE